MHRASPGSPTAAAIASRIAWSSALRLAGLEMVSRRIPSAGSSMSSSPGIAGARLVEHDEGVALVHRLPLLAEDLLDGAGVLGLHRHLHLHGLEDHDGVALVDRVSHGALDLPHGSGDVRFDVSHGRGRYGARWTPSSSSAPGMRPTGCPPPWRRSATRSRARGSSSPTTARPTRPRPWRARGAARPVP